MSNLKGSTLNIHVINCIVKLKFFYLNLSLPRVTKEEFVFLVSIHFQHGKMMKRKKDIVEGILFE